MKKACLLIDWIGCPRNVLLKLRAEDFLTANGYAILPPAELEDCDLAAFFACGFTYPQQRKGFRIVQAVHDRIDKLEKPPTFIVAGCLPPINGRELRQYHNGPTIPFLEIDRLEEFVDGDVPMSAIPLRHDVTSEERVRVTLEREHFLPVLSAIRGVKRVNESARQSCFGMLKRYLPEHFKDEKPFDYYQMGTETWCVLTSVGCEGTCSYCVIRRSKGALQSRPIADIVEETRQGIAKGYRWISLVADDNGVYGRDIGTDLGQLLLELDKLDGDFRILVDSLSPKHFVEFFDPLMEVFTSGRIERICLAIQHVSPRITESMNRAYDTEAFRQRLLTLMHKLPEFKIDSHFIVGYPGETEEEFQEMYDFIDWMLTENPTNEFKQFPFSANPGTPAARMENQIPVRTLFRRARRLTKLRRDHGYRLYRQRIEQSSHPTASRMAHHTAKAVIGSSIFFDDMLGKVERRFIR